MTIKSRAAAVAVITALVGGAAVPRPADGQLSLRPHIGVYIPTANLIEVAQTGNVGKLEAGPSFGAGLGYRFGSHFGIDLTGSYVPTTFKLGAGNTITKQDAKLYLGNALAVIYLLPPTSLLSVFVDGGVGVVGRGGVAFTSQAQTTDVAGAAGAGAGIRLGGIQLLGGVDLLSYKAKYQGAQQTASELRQLDVQLKFGVGFGFGAIP